MDSKKTVVMGEASEDSDSDEIFLGDETPKTTLDKVVDQQVKRNCDMTKEPEKPKGNYGTSLLSNIIQRTSSFYPFNHHQSTSATKTTTATNNNQTATSMPMAESPQSVSLLHKSLYNKNQQLYACLNHFYRHPLQKASRDMNDIGHTLVNVQKGLQEIEGLVAKLGRDKKYYDMDIQLMAIE